MRKPWRRSWTGAFLGLAVICAACASPPTTGAATTDTSSAGPTEVSTSPSAGAGPSVIVSAAPTGSSSVPSAAGEVSAPLPNCGPDKLATRVPGRLAVGTAVGAAPWFIGPPATGSGLDRAVAVAVAARLGYSATQIDWRTVDPVAATRGTATGVDLTIGQFVVPDGPGAQNAPADFSTGYFSVTDVVVAKKSAAAPVATLAAIAALRVATVAASSGDSQARASLPGGRRITAFATAAAARKALDAGTADVAVLDVLSAVADPELTVLGELPTGQWQPPQLGLVLAKDSPLTACVSASVDVLRVEGKLAGLRQTWLPLPTLR